MFCLWGSLSTSTCSRVECFFRLRKLQSSVQKFLWQSPGTLMIYPSTPHTRTSTSLEDLETWSRSKSGLIANQLAKVWLLSVQFAYGSCFLYLTDRTLHRFLSDRWSLGWCVHFERLLSCAGDVHQKQQCDHIHSLLWPSAGHQWPWGVQSSQHLPVRSVWEDDIWLLKISVCSALNNIWLCSRSSIINRWLSNN